MVNTVAGINVARPLRLGTVGRSSDKCAWHGQAFGQFHSGVGFKFQFRSDLGVVRCQVLGGGLAVGQRKQFCFAP